MQEECGQVLPMVALMMAVLLGMAALVVDYGRAVLSYRQLQASCDAAALAGAAALSSPQGTTDVQAAATAYSAESGMKNANANLQHVAAAAGYPKLLCLTSLAAQGAACTAPLNANAVQVAYTASVPLFFAAIFGQKTLSISASATAAEQGGSPVSYNVAIILDETPSMGAHDDNCSKSKIACALAGMRVLLSSLEPCGLSQSNCSISGGNATNSVDRVSIFSFPEIVPSTAKLAYACTSSKPTATTYDFPLPGATSYAPGSGGTYQVIDFQSDYRTSDSAPSLNLNSNLALAAGGKPGCNGDRPPANGGNYQTFYASVIYAAQSALIAEQAAYPGSKNMMIILSDGDATTTSSAMVQQSAGNPHGATASGYYPSWKGMCGQAVTAAKAATAAGTTVYTIAYGTPQTGCSSDTVAGAYPGITPCQTMADMASNSKTFYSDYLPDSVAGTCYATAQPATAISSIFQSIANSTTSSRLIPDNTP